MADDYGGYEDLEGPPAEHMFPDPNLDHDALCEGGPPGLAKPPGSIPDFLPSAQRALYLRIQQKQQEEEERARRLESSKQERENEEGKWEKPRFSRQIHACRGGNVDLLQLCRWEVGKEED